MLIPSRDGLYLWHHAVPAQLYNLQLNVQHHMLLKNYPNIWCIVWTMLFRLRDHPMFFANQPKRLEMREISTTHFESWKSLRHNVAEDKVWIILGFSNLPGYVEATDTVIYLHFRRVDTWTICGQTLDFPESRECPLFVPLQRDQMANWKIMKSKIWLVFVHQFFSQFGPTGMT